MKSWSLRSQAVAVIAFLWLYCLGVGAAYWVQSAAHGRLEQSFHHDLAVLSRLPRLRDQLRQLDSSTDHYLLSGNARWLDKRREALERVRETAGVLAGLRSGGKEGAILVELDRRLSANLAQQNQWISRKKGGRLPPAEAERLIGRRRGLEDLTGLLVQMKDANVGELERRRREVTWASRLNLALILLTGLAACLLLAFFLARYIVGPIERLHRYALGWTLGSEWSLASPRASPEIQDLLVSMKKLTARLNKQYEREHDLAQLKGRLVSMVSHEFNNVLATLGGVSILLRETETSQPDEKRSAYYAVLDSNIRALTLAASNLLDMGRMETGRFAVKVGRAEIPPIVREALKGLELLAQRKGLVVSEKFPREPRPALADPEALSLVVTNLIANAIKYTPERGRITVGIAPEGAQAMRVYCRDTGIGISAQDQEKIFSGYYRTEEGRRAAKGLGLGLALASSIIEAHGSRLEVQSAPGKGSQFSFVLPLWKEEAGPAGSPGPA